MGDETIVSSETAIAHGRRLLADQPRLAAEQARAVLEANPANARALRLLAAAHRATGDEAAADKADEAALAAAARDPLLVSAGQALVANDLPVAEPLLRARLKDDPFDTAAIRMMAELAARIGRFGDCEGLLRRALELAPGFAAARANLATVLYRQQRPAEAIVELNRLADEAKADGGHQSLKAAALSRIGSYEEAIALYRQLLADAPEQAALWMSLGHLLKTVGQREEAIAAYRRAVALRPGFGEAWWSLANLKTALFDDADVAAMEAALGGSGDDDRLHLLFALGKAAEDRREEATAWSRYAAGNAVRAGQLGHDRERVEKAVDAAMALFTADFFAARAGWGAAADDPIFILGMPRAGSTLLEQILASHPLVEGTMELPDIIALSRTVEGYPAALEKLDRAAVEGLGRAYLERTQVQRREGTPLFIDKMPNNWIHTGLIRLILPNARIVDARRHPLACGFSNFKQHYARGQSFSYDLGDFGHYYAQYCRFMAHIDAVQPGAVRRVIHEALVDDPEAEIRALLDDLRLPFDARCLAHHETERAVRTPSSEQVRQPINRKGLDAWRAHDAELGPLREALGSWLEDWRN